MSQYIRSINKSHSIRLTIFHNDSSASNDIRSFLLIAIIGDFYLDLVNHLCGYVRKMPIHTNYPNPHTWPDIAQSQEKHLELAFNDAQNDIVSYHIRLKQKDFKSLYGQNLLNDQVS